MLKGCEVDREKIIRAKPSPERYLIPKETIDHHET